MSRRDGHQASQSRLSGCAGHCSSMRRGWLLLVTMLLIGSAIATASSAQPITPAAAAVKPAGAGGLGDLPQVEGPAIKGGCDDTRIAAKLAELRAEITGPSTSEVLIDCSLRLKPDDVIVKRLVFKGKASSGVTVDGNGAIIDSGRGTFHFDKNRAVAMVEITSVDEEDPATGAIRSTRPVNVTLRNLRIRGSVVVHGNLELPSTDPHYLERVRDNAPRNITLDGVTITSLGLPCSERSTNCTPLYVHGGVGSLQMINSTIHGTVRDGAVAIYLDDASFGHTFRNNTISAVTRTREVMALDGSSDNLIAGNRFSNYERGGIHLYLNCGEGGNLRRGTPSRNVIIDNVFQQRNLRGPAIHVASRNGKGTSSYTCPPTFFDDARFNAVMLNRIESPPSSPAIPNLLDALILVGRPDVNGPNLLKDNEIVNRADARPAGCFVSNGYPDLLRDGQFVEVFQSSDGGPICRGVRVTCRDGVLVRSNDDTCRASALSTVEFECRADGSNDGCRKTLRIPAGKTIIGASALCNLESGSIAEEDMGKMQPNAIRVLRASDKVSEGSCTLGATQARNHQAAVSLLRLNELARATGQVTFGCRERDANGGDCHMRGTLRLR